MSSPKSRISRLLLLPALALVSSCGERERIQVAFPPAADIEAATEAKPVPTDEIASSQQAYDQYQASVEAWGDRLSAAGKRICRWAVTNGAKLDCPK